MDAEKIPVRTDKKLTFWKVQGQAGRDVQIMVCRNVNKHVYIEIGRDVTLILHPHAARRLLSGVSAVLDGEESVHP